MGIHRIAQNVMNTKWDLTDDFQFFISNKNFPLTTKGYETTQDIFDKCVISIDLPQMGSDVQNIMIAGEYRIYNDKHQPFAFTVTFRDFAGLSLRDYFTGVWIEAQSGYFNDVRSTVKISIDGTLSFASDDCLISSVSQVQFNNNDSQIVEFTVEFSSPYFTNSKISKFGTDGYKAGSKGGII